MAVTPIGPISEIKHALRDMVAGLPAWRQLLESYGVRDLPADRIHLNAARLLEIDCETFPRAVVCLPEDANRFEAVAGGGLITLRPAGKLLLGFAVEAGPDPYSDDSATEFDNFIGAIWMELAELAGEDAVLGTVGLSWFVPPRITKPGEGHARQFWIAIIVVDWE
ncbi:MAG: hypothetical protein JNG90_19510 [Planctomycetaceae bacterium]|nr:hypothetical protein [Planctomycetaceae bacterium]